MGVPRPAVIRRTKMPCSRNVKHGTADQILSWDGRPARHRRYTPILVREGGLCALFASTLVEGPPDSRPPYDDGPCNCCAA